MEKIRRIVLRVDTKGRKQLSRANNIAAYLSDRILSILRIIEKDIGANIVIDIQHEQNNKKYEYIYSINFNFDLAFIYDTNEVIESVYSMLNNIFLMAKNQGEFQGIEDVYNDFLNSINGFENHIERETIIFRLDNQLDLISKKLTSSTLNVDIYRLWQPEKTDVHIEARDRKSLNAKKQISFFDEFDENQKQGDDAGTIIFDSEELIEELTATIRFKKIKGFFSPVIVVNNKEICAVYDGNIHEKLIETINNMLINSVKIKAKINPDGSNWEIIDLHSLIDSL